jgi:hypothetical protein
MFSIVLVCLGTFQEYIMTNIAQLIRLGHTTIYVLTNAELFPHFEPFCDILRLISVETLEDPFHFAEKSRFDKEWRTGFWHYTSARFFVIHSFMEKYGVNNVIHIENDVVLYYNCDDVLTVPLLGSRQVHIPFDSYVRNIASIMYIPDAAIFGQILNHYDYSKNDMYNFSIIRKKTDLIDQFPIFVEEDKTAVLGTCVLGTDVLGTCVGERAFVSRGWSRFGKYIFDAAAIGQYIGGVDPQNCATDSRGFVNETCVIKYNEEGTIVWKIENGMMKPFLRMKCDQEIPIFNLHIHSKQLVLYV